MNAISSDKGFVGSPTGTVVIAVLACVFIAGGVFLWWYENVGPGYYSELDKIRGQFQAIPEVTVQP
jgi:hypothetical protein